MRELLLSIVAAAVVVVLLLATLNLEHDPCEQRSNKAFLARRHVELRGSRKRGTRRDRSIAQRHPRPNDRDDFQFAPEEAWLFPGRIEVGVERTNVS